MAVTLPKELTEAISVRNRGNIRVRYFWSASEWADIGDFVQSVEWSESQDEVAREFTLTLDNWAGGAGRITAGGVLVIDIGPTKTARWVEWFRGTVVSDSPAHDSQAQNKVLTAYDPLRVFGQSEGTWSFRKGLRADQSIRNLLARTRVPVGVIADTKKPLPAFTYEGTWYDAIESLLSRTRRSGGSHYVPVMHAGKFYLVKYDRPSWFWDIDAVVGSIRAETSIANVATKAITRGLVVTAGKGRTSLSVAQANQKALAQFGVIQVVDDIANTSKPELRARAAQQARTRAVPERTLEVELPFEALSLRRLQAVQFDNRDPVTGAYGRYYISRLSGRVDGDGGSMTLSLTRDPAFPVLQSLGEAGTSANPAGYSQGSSEWPGDSASRAAVAQWMGSIAAAEGLPPELPVMASLVETIGQLKNIQYGDADSIGLFQMRVSVWAGQYPGFQKDPEKQMDWFVTSAKEVQSKKGYKVGQDSRYGEWIADVERPLAAYRGRYQPKLAEARQLLGLV